ncbi:MAG: 50S ribosomal protein L32 [Phycisphaeraceae bacterium]|nr:50S ribosomal protein L32 [Phycisphaeraceae bacterium]
MVPCQRKTRSQRGNRRSHDALRAVTPARCPNCGNTKQPHAACTECGYVRPGLKLQLSSKEE